MVPAIVLLALNVLLKQVIDIKMLVIGDGIKMKQDKRSVNGAQVVEYAQPELYLKQKMIWKSVHQD